MYFLGARASGPSVERARRPLSQEKAFVGHGSPKAFRKKSPLPLPRGRGGTPRRAKSPPSSLRHFSDTSFISWVWAVGRASHGNDLPALPGPKACLANFGRPFMGVADRFPCRRPCRCIWCLSERRCPRGDSLHGKGGLRCQPEGVLWKKARLGMNIFPGFKMSLGSRARLMRTMASKAPGSTSH